MRKKFITKLYKYNYGYFYDLVSNDRVDIKNIERIYAEGFCWITTFEGKVIRKTYVDENNNQLLGC